jgi:hypothetical protein
LEENIKKNMKRPLEGGILPFRGPLHVWQYKKGPLEVSQGHATGEGEGKNLGRNPLRCNSPKQAGSQAHRYQELYLVIGFSIR